MITTKTAKEIIEFIDAEMSAFNAVASEDYDYERDNFIDELAEKVIDKLNANP